MLDEDGLEGILAHKLSHIKHKDILISTIAAWLAQLFNVLGWRQRLKG